MKRPLFWAVIAFALGEVEGMYIDRIWQTGIALAMLICVVIYLTGGGAKGKYIIALWIFMLLGMLNVNLRQPCTVKTDTEVSVYGMVYNKVISSGGVNGYIKICELDAVSPDKTIRVVMYDLPQEIKIGDYIKVEGMLYDIKKADNPGQFDTKRYYCARGIEACLKSLNGCLVIGSEDKIKYNYKNYIFEMRLKLSEKLMEIFGTDMGAIYSGLLVGVKQDISEDIKALYQVGGISHILAISGLHISLIGMFISKILRLSGLNVHIACAVSVLLIILYGELAGWSFATIRAIIMLIMRYGGVWFGRKPDVLTGAAVSLWIMIIVCPYRLIDSGLILSFSAISGVAYGQYIERRINEFNIIKNIRKKKRFIYSILSTLVMAISLQIVMVPVICVVYFEYPTYSVLINLLVIPLMNIVIVCGMLALIVSYINPAFAVVVGFPGEMILKLYKGLCELVLKLPFNTICTGKPCVVFLVLYFFTIGTLAYITEPAFHRRIREHIYKYRHKWYEKKEWYRVFAAFYFMLALVFAGGLYMIHRINLCEQIIFLDVGQGDGALIRTKTGINMVIDGGSVSEDNIGKNILKPALKSQCMSHVDYWFVSHTDRDHISGLLEILDEGILSGIEIERIVLSENAVKDENMEELIEYAKKCEVDIIYIDSGEIITDNDSFSVNCIHPDSEFITDDKNQASMALVYSSKNTEALFTGDMDKVALEYMYMNELKEEQRKYNIIKVPHHGSKYSCYNIMYENADMAVISCGKNNSYGHPHSETVEVIKSKGVELYQTSECGAVKVVFRW